VEPPLPRSAREATATPRIEVLINGIRRRRPTSFFAFARAAARGIFAAV